MVQTLSRELLMSSGLSVCDPPNWESNPPPKCDPDTGTFSKIVRATIQANESGTIDLSRLQLGAVAVLGSKEKEKRFVDVLASTKVTNIRVYNSVDLIRGQGNKVVPASVFSPFRQYGAIQLGVWRFDTGSTVEIEMLCEFKAKEPTHYFYSAAAPFTPTNPRDYVVSEDLSGRQATYAGAERPKEEVSESIGHDDFKIVKSTLTIEFDQDGIVDLGSLQLLDLNEKLYQGRSTGIETAFVESIMLPTREQVVIGELQVGETALRNLRAPAAIFASNGRRFDWVNLGLLEVSASSRLEISLGRLVCDKDSDKALSPFAAGVQFYPRR